MSTTVLQLVLSTLVASAYLGVQSVLWRMDKGWAYSATSRDNERPSGILAARGNKALRNFLETYGIFIALAAATELSGRADWLTEWGAWVWFAGRIGFLPLYVTGTFLLRSVMWQISMIGLGMMFLGVMF